MPELNKNNQRIVPYNVITEDKYLIPQSLHKALYLINNKQVRKNLPYIPISKDDEDAIYIVGFRRLNNKSDCIIYNYVKYRKEFLDSLIGYFIYRNIFIDIKEFSDKRNYFVVLDNKFLDEPKSFIKPKNPENKTGVNLSVLLDDDREMLKNISNINNINSLIEITNRVLYIADTNKIGVLIDMTLQKSTELFADVIFKDFNISDNLTYYRTDNLLNSSLYVVNSLNSVIKQLQELGYRVNEGPEKWRGQINTINSFLSLLDFDYRESLYSHYEYHKSSLNPTIYQPLKPRNFSFSTIHQNIGNVRWYSQSVNRGINKRYFHSTVVKQSRSQLIENNFLILRNLIEQNKNLSDYELQEEIEKMLHNQEDIFSSENVVKSKLNFGDKGLELLDQKREQLIKLLKVPYKISNSKRVSFSDELIPWYEKIQNELGDKKIIDILFSYYMYMLSKETLNIDDEITPGIPTIMCYTDFGKKFCNKYVFSRYAKYKKENKVDISLSQYINQNIDIRTMFEDETFYARVGGSFLYNLCVVNMLTEEIDQSFNDSKETMYYLRIHNDARKIFIQNNVRLYHLPLRLPMVCKPKPYVYSKDPMFNKLGGYLMNDVYYSNTVVKTPRKYGIPTEFSEDNIIIDEVNGLASTPFKINQDTLDYVIEYGISKNILVDSDNEEIKEYINNPYKGISKRLSKKYRSIISQILMQRYILNIALIYSVRDKIYFPTRLDFRTRIYCDTDYFDYQKGDLARGLILFTDPGKIYKHDITAINYFKAFGANMFGLDKKSLNYRVKWIDDHKDLILNFKDNDIVDRAENKVSFVSFCFEYIRFIEYIEDENRNVFFTHLPIQLDARCNCYQHLALLTKENLVYDKLNLASSSFDDDPNDFYSFILNQTNTYIEKKIQILKNADSLSEKEAKILDTYKLLKDINFDRSIVKKTIMTKSYNSTIPKQIELIVKELDEHFEGASKYYLYKNKEVKIRRAHVTLFVMCLKDVINTETPRIEELSKYLEGIAVVCTELDIPIPWKLPNGAEINESYLVKKEKKLKAFSFVKSKYTFKKYIKGEYDLARQKRSTTPNLIHSLDATTIDLLYKDFRKIGPMFTVHDCFAVTADNVNKLISKLRIVYTKLYSDSGYLRKFDDLVRTNINQTFGDETFKIDSDVVTIIKKNKVVKVPFPDVNRVISYDYNNKFLKNAMASPYILI